MGSGQPVGRGRTAGHPVTPQASPRPSYRWKFRQQTDELKVRKGELRQGVDREKLGADRERQGADREKLAEEQIYISSL